MAPHPRSDEHVDDGEDDYLTMTFEEPTKGVESSLQRAHRLRREGEKRAVQPSKAEREAQRKADEDAKREEGLAKAIDESNKGFKMMQKLGFKGGTLGKSDSNPEALTKPIQVEMKDGKGGLGMAAEKKRKLMESVESQTKKAKTDELDYRERIRQEREHARLTREVYNAMKTLQQVEEKHTPKSTAEIPTKRVNVLWRSLARDQSRLGQERRHKRALQDLDRRLPTYEDPDEREPEYRHAFNLDEEDQDDQDTELDEFLELEPAERLSKITAFLREKYCYCYWCKFQYTAEDLEECPGPTEEDHE